ncbi:MAG: hypothetical protein IJH68_12385 [Thermoguttaceae bacterium]|nr:hypothetical protein [Thermoguttaceae bacterium]
MLKRFILTFACVLFAAAAARGAELYIGAASVDFTPDRPVLLQGQMSTRVAQSAATPVTANAIALEARDGDRPLDRAILVSVDLCSVRFNLREAILRKVKDLLPGFSAEEKLIVAATHTHTSVATSHDYVLPEDLPEGVSPGDILMEDEAAEYLAEKIAGAIKLSWDGRVRGEFAYGLGNAVIAFNRRSVYEDGSAVMYGPTNRDDFRKIEGMEDHDVGCCFFWDSEGKLLAMIVNPSCPAQEVESLSVINADYWHPVREALRAKYGDDVVIAGFTGAAGDLSPHVRYRQAAVDRMTRLRGEDNLHEIARKIVAAVDEVYPVVESHRESGPVFAHTYTVFDLPQQTLPRDVYEHYKKQMNDEKAACDNDRNHGAGYHYVNYLWSKGIVDRYDAQQGVENPVYPVDAHFLRLGDLAICTNPFELYTDFGVQIKARAQATQTIIIQLTAPLVEPDYCYVPSKYAVQGGGYGAIPETNNIGMEGGQIFADKSVEQINALFGE